MENAKKIYDEMISASASKCIGNIVQELLDAIYEDIVNGNLKFEKSKIKQRVDETLGKGVNETLNLKIENVYEALRRRLVAPENPV